jgi:hypothetical protein
MKTMMKTSFAAAALLFAAGLATAAETQAPGFVDFGKFAPPGGGGEFVEVNLKNNLISMVSRLAGKEEPEVAEVLRGLQLIRVNVIGLDDKNRSEVQERVKKIRDELDTKGWERVVTAQQKDEDVGIYLKLHGDEAVDGVVVTVLEGNREAVLINIVGDIKPEKLAAVGERLNIEPLKKLGKELKKS